MELAWGNFSKNAGIAFFQYLKHLLCNLWLLKKGMSVKNCKHLNLNIMAF